MDENKDLSDITVYDCDPDKNIMCSKTSCYLNGGECSCTLYEQYKIDGTIGRNVMDGWTE